MNNLISIASRKRRIFAFTVDHIMFCALAGFAGLAAMGQNIESHTQESFGRMMYVVVLMFLAYFMKDCIGGASPGKRLMGLRVRDESNHQITPKFWSLFVRNLFIAIWPVEFIVLATSKDKQRIGDRIAKTIVIRDEAKVRSAPIVVAVGLGAAVVFVVTLFFGTITILKQSDAYRVATQEIRSNFDITEITGTVRSFGAFPTGSIEILNGRGKAEFDITVEGDLSTAEVYVRLSKEPEQEWVVDDMGIPKL